MNYDLLVEKEFLSNAEELILDHLDDDQFDVAKMARELGMSRTSLYRRFKSVSGISPSTYLTTVRLSKAMELLKGSTFSITEIAFECGFRSLTYFDTCFRKHYGLPPGKVRKNNRPVKESMAVQINQDGRQFHNFPVFATKFIGRKKEIAGIRELLKTSRIVSLIGPGGCGKTRLACEAVKSMGDEFKDGIWFVDLAPVETDDLIVKVILNTLQIPETPNTDLLETLTGRIENSELLIILDNCEHLAEGSAEIAGRLSSTSSGLKVLITSRAAMNIRGEKVWKIPSLSLKDPATITMVGEATESEAILLFEDRARMNDQRFELNEMNIRNVAIICMKLDGIPLALELVAHRTRFMDPGKILERFSGRLSDIPSVQTGTADRHRTMNSAIEWSYNLLRDEQKILFRRLSVFSGVFDLEAAEKVCSGKEIPVEYILDLLSDLVDQSMVMTIRRAGEPLMYRLLEPLRQYVSGQMDEKETDEFRKRHLAYYTSLARSAYNDRLSSQEFWMTRLGMEQDNLMAALKWAEVKHPVRYSRLAGLLAWYWTRSKQIYLARKTLGKLVEKGNISGETRAMVLSGYGWSLAGQVDQYLYLTEIIAEAIAIWKRLGNKKEEVIARTDQAALYFGAGDDEAAVAIIQDAYKEALKVNDNGVLLYCMLFVSQGYVNTRQFREARSSIAKVRKLAGNLDNVFARFATHHNLGDCALMEGYYEEAEREYGEGVKITHQFGDLFYLFTDLAGLAMAVAGMRRHAKALRIISGVNQAAEKEGIMSPEIGQMSFWKEQMQLHIQGTREKLGETLTRKYETEGAALDLEELITYALDYKTD